MVEPAGNAYSIWERPVQNNQITARYANVQLTMANHIEIELPLYNAFMELMRLEKGQPNKGIDPGSYLQLIDVLHKGYALNSKEELIFFCKKLWLKPFHRGNAAITEQVLENVLLSNLRA